MKIKTATIDEIKASARSSLDHQIRTVYSTDEEFRIINLGIVNNQDPEYLEYRATINALVENYRNTWKESK
jgi:hypothetical protein